MVGKELLCTNKAHKNQFCIIDIISLLQNEQENNHFIACLVRPETLLHTELVRNSVEALHREAWRVSWQGRNRAVCHLGAARGTKTAQGVE